MSRYFVIDPARSTGFPIHLLIEALCRVLKDECIYSLLEGFLFSSPAGNGHRYHTPIAMENHGSLRNPRVNGLHANAKNNRLWAVARLCWPLHIGLKRAR